MHGSDTKFYKYLSPDAAFAVLTNKTLKWSNPRLFNDPFEFPAEMDFSFDGDELAEALMDETVKLAYGPEEPNGNIEHPLFAISMITRRNQNKPEEDVFRRYMADSMKETAHRYNQDISGLRDFYRSFRDQFAVLCVSKIHDDLLMWAHYAQNHTGCVMKFRCLPEKDRPLCMAQEVKYQSEYPLRAGLHDYVKHLTGQVELNDDNLFQVFALTKSEHWRYEKEWRCISLLNNRESGFDYDRMIPEELEAVYLGCRIDEATKNQIKAILLDQYPDAQIYQAHTDVQNYALRFAQIR